MDGDCKQCWTLWIDWENHVISFQKAKDFEEVTIDTHAEMLCYAVEKGSEGYAIQ